MIPNRIIPLSSKNISQTSVFVLLFLRAVYVFVCQMKFNRNGLICTMFFASFSNGRLMVKAFHKWRDKTYFVIIYVSPFSSDGENELQILVYSSVQFLCTIHHKVQSDRASVTFKVIIFSGLKETQDSKSDYLEDNECSNNPLVWIISSRSKIRRVFTLKYSILPNYTRDDAFL